MGFTIVEFEVHQDSQGVFEVFASLEEAITAYEALGPGSHLVKVTREVLASHQEEV